MPGAYIRKKHVALPFCELSIPKCMEYSEEKRVYMVEWQGHKILVERSGDERSETRRE